MADRANSPRLIAAIELGQVLLLAGNLGWTTLCLGGYRPETMVVTSILTGLLLLVHLAGRLVAGSPFRLHPAGWLFLPFLAYAAANVTWHTPVPWLGWHDWLWWAQLIVVFWVVVNLSEVKRASHLLLATLALLGFVTVVLAAYQVFVKPDWLMLGRRQAEQFIGRASGSFGIPNSLAALLLLLLPASVALTLRPGATAVQRVGFGYLAASYLFGLVLTASRGAWIALALILLGWPLMAGQRSRAWRVSRFGLAVAVLVVTGVTAYLAMPTLRNRFEAMVHEAGERTRPIMWRGAWQLFREQPVWGSGAGSYNVAFEKHRPAHFQLDSQWAHNDYLNTLSDYGAVGFGLFFGACGWVVIAGIRRTRAQPRPVAGAALLDSPPVRQGFALGLGAFGLQLFVDFHLKIPALGMALAIVAGLLVRTCWHPTAASTGRSLPRAAVLGLAVMAVAAGLVIWVVPHYRAEALRYSARQAMDKLVDREIREHRDTLESVRTAMTRAVAIDPTNAQAWSDLAYATSLRAHLESGFTRKLGVEAEQQADRALRLAKIVPEFWLRRAVALDMQDRWLEAGDSCIQAMNLAPSHALVWYYYSYHLSLNPAAVPQARAAVEISLRLDPSIGPAQLLRQQLAARESSRQSAHHE
ncbi:MAG: O-antigen ligase family protein [Opitutaceae bacterium]|nr:O-antigen ligase family protein [Opitutaceae bacterium]